ncbi:lysophospholipid acyltransferase family protein [Oceanicoccus sp. KOV_DT_Chl]|uniref:GNAT family N-acyltransferase n=1 Tax=Oceanicoccus sp. KOV_DT_Chl TaxID=1904639 RepID=UPI000C7A018E|nr:lysophospholipid acyltransferase family protein [Oceanicoccus sp. KOV_DT_Chl]
MISIESVLEQKLPGLSERQPLLGKTLLKFMRYLFHEREFQQFGETYPHVEGFDFVEQALAYFDFSYRVKASEQERIPTHGRVVIVANHPIGSLDGLALLKMIGEIRPDVKAVANEILYALDPLRSLLLPVDNMNGRSGKVQLRAIKDHLAAEGAVIIFPAGEVSRMSPTGIKDGRWNSGFLRFAKSRQAPILPVFVDGRNSIFFYSLSILAKPISTLWLIREMFKHAKNHVDISVGHLVYPEQYQGLGLKPDAVAKLFKKNTYRLPKKNKPQLGFVTEFEAVAHPENRQLLKREIGQCELLGATADGKSIYLFHYKTSSVIMREIGRLRELTFRAVKEGTGRRRDIDIYDSYYDHLVLWDDQELEIVGAYRMAQSQQLLASQESKKLYTQTLFNFEPGFNRYFANGLELGRSFVQPKFWGMRSLDYLWYGIGAYLKRYPDIRYLFGPVSISHDYPDKAKDLLICFYAMHFGSDEPLASAKNPYLMNSECNNLELAEMFSGDDYATEFKVLKEKLTQMDLAVPTLYKQYTELCEPGGATFSAFNVDHDFADCVDGLIVVDLTKVKANKRKRYLDQN